jgi:DNA polymerase I
MIIWTDNDTPLPPFENDQVYNGLDCMITVEILEKRLPHLDPHTSKVYAFERDLQGPVLEMNLRGLRLEPATTYETLSELNETIQRLEENLRRLCEEGLGVPKININSPKQIADLLYSHLGIPFRRSRTGGPATDRETLENLQIFFHARPFLSTILALRDHYKLAQVFKKAVSSDSRIRCSYNISGTKTGRFSSSSDAFGEGTNLQTITERLRRNFIPDPGHKIAYFDLEQAESRAVAYLAYEATGLDNYIRACESGDLHTEVSKMIWPEIQTRADADKIFYRFFSYRDLAKRGGHGTNYFGRPATMAKNLKVAKPLMEEFQREYFRAFPEIRKWHYDVIKKIQLEGRLRTPLGRTRTFFGRRDDDTTIRSAIAQNPQSLVGDILNMGLLNVWRSGLVQILAQIHDAILFQYPIEAEKEILPQISTLMTIEVPVADRILQIPVEGSVGWNWAKASPTNPGGLAKWKGKDERSFSIDYSRGLLSARAS